MIHFLHQIVQDLLKANQLLRASLNSLLNCHGCPQQTMVVQKSLVTSLRSLTHKQECGDGLWPPRLRTPPWNVWRNSRNTSSECSLRTLSESVNPERNRRKSSPERLCQMSTMMISVSNIRTKKMTWSRNVDEVAHEYLLQFSHDVIYLFFCSLQMMQASEAMMLTLTRSRETCSASTSSVRSWAGQW